MQALNQAELERFAQALAAQEGNIIIVPHTNPDGDAIGSTLGLTRILQNAGKQVTPVVPNNFPEFLAWVHGSEQIRVFDKQTEEVKALLNEATMLICLDFNQTSRTDEMAELLETFQGTTVLIDHHPFPQGFTEIQFSHPEYSSTCELVLHVMKGIGYEKHIDHEAAEALFCGILTDTGSFHHGVSDAQTFRSVSELVELGVNPEAVSRRVMNNYSANRMQLMGHCLSECMIIIPELHAAIMWLSLADQHRFNYQKGDNEGFVNMPLSIKDIYVSAFFTENDHQVKGSLRSQGDFPVNEIANKYFGGGGHLNAAGCEIKDKSLMETVELFKGILKEYAPKLQNVKLD
ncbi:MAG: DHH family phosphoesterase [Mangrovibacterium sp.]